MSLLQMESGPSKARLHLLEALKHSRLLLDHKQLTIDMKFIKKNPRRTRPVPEWTKNLEHEESRLWLMNNHEMAHVRELIAACEYYRLQWIEKGLRSPESELSTEEFNEVFKMIEKQHEDLLEHLLAINDKNRQIHEELGGDLLKEKEQ